MTRSYQIKNRMNSATFMSDPYCVGTSTLLQLKKDKIRLYNRRSNIFDKEDKSDIGLSLLNRSEDSYFINWNDFSQL